MESPKIVVYPKDSLTIDSINLLRIDVSDIGLQSSLSTCLEIEMTFAISQAVGTFSSDSEALNRICVGMASLTENSFKILGHTDSGQSDFEGTNLVLFLC